MALIDPYDSYIAAGTSFSRLAPQGTGTQLVYATFNEGRRTLLPFVDTGLMYPGQGGAMGDPALFRYFYGIRFGGAGKLYLRVMVDNRESSRGFVTLVEDTYGSNYMRLPRGEAGYGIRLQIVGLAWWRYFEIDWDPVVNDEQEVHEP